MMKRLAVVGCSLVMVGAACGAVTLRGLTGESVGRCIRARAYSDWARGAMYEEAVRAFRTHWDDMVGYGGWQNEYWGKTMLCFAGAIEYTRDPELRDWCLRKTHAFLDEFQQPNGYLSTYLKEDFLRDHPESTDANKHWCHNIWGRKYTFWALLELHRVTGDTRCLDAACKMADHLIAQLDRLQLTLDRTGSWNGISSMSILRPLNDLIRRADAPHYRKLAKNIVDVMAADRDDPGALIHNALRPEKTYTLYPDPGLWSKAYEIMSCLEGLVDYYRLTGDRRALEGAEAYYRHIVAEEMNPMQGVGYFDHFWDAAHRVNGMTELCDVIHWIRLNREFYLLTGKAAYAERMEEAFFNAFLAGVSRDGRWGAHIVRSHGTRHVAAPPQTGMIEHQCCPDNMMRTYFDYASVAVTTNADASASVAFYGDADAAFRGFDVSIRGGYPWSDGTVTLVVTSASARTLRLRVPVWSKTFTVNGRAMESADGWTSVALPAGTSSWTLGFDYSPRLVKCEQRYETFPPSPQARKSNSDAGIYTVHFMEWMTPEMVGLTRLNGGVRVLRGPLVLAKGRLAGTSRDETLFATTIWDGDWTASLMPIPTSVQTAAVPAAWMLTLTGPGGVVKTIPVADFASVSNVDDPSNWFSLWF